ncbi:hypothetical protein Tco_0611586 [Tanacetum coccineum]
MSPKAVLLKTGLTPLNTVRPVNTAHPKSSVHSAKSKSHFSKQAQSTAQRPFYKQIALTRRHVHTAKRHHYTGRPKAVNVARSYTGQVSVVRVKGVNVVKTLACWVWRPTKPNGASLTFKRHNYIDAQADPSKFDGKSDEGFFVGYSLSCKAFRVYNTRTRRVEENLHIGFLENKPMLEGNGPKWLFDIDSLTQSMNYVPVTADSQNNENVEQDKFEDDRSTKDLNAAGQHGNTANPDVNTGSLKLNAVGPSVNTASSNELDGPEDEPEVDLGNITNSYIVYVEDNIFGIYKQGVMYWNLKAHRKISFQMTKILKKFNYTDVKSASTLVDLEKPLVKDGDADDVDVGDEAVHKELGDIMERVVTTTSSLEAEQDSSGPRCQDTILGDVNAQTRFEITSK